MSAIDVVDVAKTRLTAAGFSPVRTRPLTDNEEGMRIVRLPSTPTQTYMDGAQDIAYLFAVYVRYADEEAAIDQGEAVSDALLVSDMRSQNGSYQLTSISIYSPLQKVENTNGKYTYMVGFRADITIGG